MSGELHDVCLTTLRGGAAVEMFDHMLAKVLRNIADLNTVAEAERAVTLVVKFKPGADRDVAGYLVEVKAKLAPPAPVAGEMYIGRRDGQVVAVAQDPLQRDMFEPEAGEGVIPISGARQNEQEG